MSDNIYVTPKAELSYQVSESTHKAIFSIWVLS